MCFFGWILIFVQYKLGHQFKKKKRKEITTFETIENTQFFVVHLSLCAFLSLFNLKIIPTEGVGTQVAPIIIKTDMYHAFKPP